MASVEQLPRSIWWQDAAEQDTAGQDAAEQDAASGDASGEDVAGGDATSKDTAGEDATKARLVYVGLIDQRKLPSQLETIKCYKHSQMIDAIKTLALRGAPAIGAGGAFALALWAFNEAGDMPDVNDASSMIEAMKPVADEIASARPTAVNLSWAVNKVTAAAHEACKTAPAGEAGTKYVADAMLAKAKQIAQADEASNRAIGKAGADLFEELANDRDGKKLAIMTHCNAGSLATVFYGTALGVVYSAFDRGLIERVYTCETRPLNQGSRLSSWELSHSGVPTTLICDDMAASTMAAGLVDAVIVGADRIAANGDTANKIGTMGHAILAKHFGIPFYVAAPFSTIDISIPDGSHITIEQRDPSEVRGVSGSVFIDGITLDTWMATAPQDIDVLNPAFDVTPASLISAIITDKGVIFPDDNGSYSFI